MLQILGTERGDSLRYTAEVFVLVQSGKGGGETIAMAFIGHKYDAQPLTTDLKVVGISYLDSVSNGMQAVRGRAQVFLAVLEAYFELSAMSGYEHGVIWCAPPTAYKAYLFPCKPFGLMNPEFPWLFDSFYMRMLKSLQERNFVSEILTKPNLANRKNVVLTEMDLIYDLLRTSKARYPGKDFDNNFEIFLRNYPDLLEERSNSSMHFRFFNPRAGQTFEDDPAVPLRTDIATRAGFLKLFENLGGFQHFNANTLTTALVALACSAHPHVCSECSHLLGDRIAVKGCERLCNSCHSKIKSKKAAYAVLQNLLDNRTILFPPFRNKVQVLAGSNFCAPPASSAVFPTYDIANLPGASPLPSFCTVSLLIMYRPTHLSYGQGVSGLTAEKRYAEWRCIF